MKKMTTKFVLVRIGLNEKHFYLLTISSEILQPCKISNKNPLGKILSFCSLIILSKLSYHQQELYPCFYFF